MASGTRIALLGATGLTGQRLMAQALQQGHHVTAIVRSPSKVQIQHENLKVIQGDVFSTESLKDAFVGHDAVMSCLGFTPQEVTAYGDSAKAIVEAMRQAGVGRFIAMTAWYTDVDSQANAPRFVRWILLPMIRPILASMRVMEQFLCTECSDINYTVVRPPGLKNEPPTDKEIEVVEGMFVPVQDSGWLGTKGSQVSRGDVARFMLQVLTSHTWDRKEVAMTVL